MNKLIELKNRFLKWLYQYIEEDAQRQHGADIRCPGCKEWFSVSGIKYKHTYVEDIQWGCKVKCGQCGEVSNWNLVAAPVPLRCDEEGSIL